MSSKATIESKIVEFFQHGHLESVKSVFGIVKGIVRARVASPIVEGSGAAPAMPKKTRKPRAKKATASTSTSSLEDIPAAPNRLG